MQIWRQAPPRLKMNLSCIARRWCSIFLVFLTRHPPSLVATRNAMECILEVTYDTDIQPVSCGGCLEKTGSILFVVLGQETKRELTETLHDREIRSF